MKQLAISLYSLLAFTSLFSQSWQLVNPTYAYHYVEHFADGSESDSLKALSIWTDSIEGDTSWLNNTSEIHELTGFEAVYNPFRYYQLEFPHFLQRKYIHSADGVQGFSDPDTLRFLPLGSPLPWLMDPQAGIQVLSEFLYAQNTYGEADSIRQLVLSSGDTVLLSKNYGVLRFPLSYGDSTFYRQIGVSGPDAGHTFPSIKEIISFSIGDKFEYYTRNNYVQDVAMPRSTQVEALMIHQIEILDSMHLPNGIAYQTLNYRIVERGNCQWSGLKACKEVVPGTEQDADNNYAVVLQDCGTIEWDTLYYSWEQNMAYPDLPQFYEFTSFRGPIKPILPELHIGHAYPRELTYFTKVPSYIAPTDSFPPPVIYSLASISYEYHSSKDLQGRILFSYCELERGPLLDSVQCLSGNYADRSSWRIAAEWKKGLGFMRVYWEEEISYSDNYVFRELRAYETQEYSSGTFSPRSTFCSPSLSGVSPIAQGSNYLYPNPASSQFFLHPDVLPTIKTLSIFDGMGRSLFTTEEIPTDGSGFSVLNYNPGIYSIKLDREEEEALWIRLLVNP